MHVGQVGRLRAAASPDGPCLEDERLRLTSGEFAAAVERLSGGLASLGVGAGDVVATMLPNCVEMVLTLFAAWRMGVAVTPVNPALTTGEASYQLEDSGAKRTPSRPGSWPGQTSVSYRSMRSAASAARCRRCGPKLAISRCSCIRAARPGGRRASCSTTPTWPR